MAKLITTSSSRILHVVIEKIYTKELGASFAAHNCTQIKFNFRTVWLARYHDANYDKSGPIALGIFLDLPMEAVFPIEYNISAVVQGLAEGLCGIIQKTAVRLSQDALIAMAVG